jgi:uncharacterized membrane protein
MGGFFDGIVLHQILQWHHMLSSAHPADSLAALQLNYGEMLTKRMAGGRARCWAVRC